MGNLLGFVFVMGMIGAWLTHLFYCFASNLWGMLLVGSVIFPIGILHGVWLWFQ